MLPLCLYLAMALAGPAPGRPPGHPPKSEVAVAPPPIDTVLILGVTDPAEITIPAIGEINFAYPYNDEEEIIARLRSFALSHRANLVKVNADRPSNGRSVGRISATIYKVANLRAYEPRIDWTEDRRLTLADFKAPPSMPRQSHAECTFYILPADRQNPDGPVYTQTSFFTHSSWIDSSGNAAGLLQHEQGTFDLCELYRRKLDVALLSNPANLFHQRRQQDIFRQVYAAYLRTRDQYDSATLNGHDSTQQAWWSQRIATRDFPPIPILTSRRELDQQARTLPPSRHLALVYVIRPNQYNTPFWKRMVIDPYCIWPCPYFLFLNPDRYFVTFGGMTQGPIGVRKFVYRYVQSDSCELTSPNGDSMLTLHLDPGKIYFVKMKLIEKRFLGGAHPRWELLSEHSGRRWLRKCRLSRHWEYFTLPVYPDPLR